MRKPYSTDLSDAEWSCIEPHLPTPKALGRPRVHTLREVLNAIFFYIVRSGCAWRLLPHDFPPWKTIHHYFRVWPIDGAPGKGCTPPCAASGYECVWAERSSTQRPPASSTASRSRVPPWEESSAWIRWRQEGEGASKRHLLVDTQGLVLKAKVHAANVMDFEGIKMLLRQADVEFPRLKHLWLDSAYRGEDKGKDWVEKALGWSVDLVERPRKPAPEEVLKSWAKEWAKEGVKVDWQKLLPPKGFRVLPKRWVVERTFSWTDQNRRMSKDYERLTETSEAFIYVAMSRLMARRLARS